MRGGAYSEDPVTGELTRAGDQPNPAEAGNQAPAIKPAKAKPAKTADSPDQAKE